MKYSVLYGIILRARVFCIELVSGAAFNKISALLIYVLFSFMTPYL